MSPIKGVGRWKGKDTDTPYITNQVTCPLCENVQDSVIEPGKALKLPPTGKPLNTVTVRCLKCGGLIALSGAVAFAPLSTAEEATKYREKKEVWDVLHHIPTLK